MSKSSITAQVSIQRSEVQGSHDSNNSAHQTALYIKERGPSSQDHQANYQHLILR